MKSKLEASLDLVSVIIPCYNQGQYLSEAIESVLRQTYPRLEVIVVDDGSTDSTAKVVASYPEVQYVYQPNQGLSAARNKGVGHCLGRLLVFLDADDWLYPLAVETNLRYLQQNKEAAFVSGAYVNIFENGNGRNITVCKQEVISDHYYRLLQYNYIGMIAAVMFQSWVFKEFLYNESLRGSEDHDLYLKIARKYKVIHHTEKIAAYRRHGNNLSNNIPMMVANALVVLRGQKDFLETNAEKRAYNCAYRSLYYQFFLLKAPIAAENYQVFKGENYLFIKFKLLIFIMSKLDKVRMFKTKIKKRVQSFILGRLCQSGVLANTHPEEGQVWLGDLNRTAPLSTSFGFDRGGAIDRYYIERFLEKEANSIQGSVLEIGDNSYTIQYGGENITKSDILHVDGNNKSATLIGDISHAPHILDNSFDCLILTQTLHLIYNFKEALQTCHRILKPGGTLLLTVPGITPIDHDEWEDTWYWSFTDKSMKKLMEECFPKCGIEVNSYGNVFAATTFLYGMGLTEVSKEKLDVQDSHFQVIVTVKAVKTEE